MGNGGRGQRTLARPTGPPAHRVATAPSPAADPVAGFGATIAHDCAATGCCYASLPKISFATVIAPIPFGQPV